METCSFPLLLLLFFYTLAEIPRPFRSIKASAFFCDVDRGEGLSLAPTHTHTQRNVETNIRGRRCSLLALKSISGYTLPLVYSLWNRKHLKERTNEIVNNQMGKIVRQRSRDFLSFMPKTWGTRFFFWGIICCSCPSLPTRPCNVEIERHELWTTWEPVSSWDTPVAFP